MNSVGFGGGYEIEGRGGEASLYCIVYLYLYSLFIGIGTCTGTDGGCKKGKGGWIARGWSGGRGNGMCMYM